MRMIKLPPSAGRLAAAATAGAAVIAVTGVAVAGATSGTGTDATRRTSTPLAYTCEFPSADAASWRPDRGRVPGRGDRRPGDTADRRARHDHRAAGRAWRPSQARGRDSSRQRQPRRHRGRGPGISTRGLAATAGTARRPGARRGQPGAAHHRSGRPGNSRYARHGDLDGGQTAPRACSAQGRWHRDQSSDARGLVQPEPWPGRATGGSPDLRILTITITITFIVPVPVRPVQHEARRNVVLHQDP